MWIRVTSASSDPAVAGSGRARAGLRGVGIALLLLVLLPGALAPQPADVHREGEYGLWVQRNGDHLEVRWFTRSTSPGFLEVRRSDTLVHRRETGRSFLHTATVPFPSPEEGRLRLQYGSTEIEGDQHETPLRLPLDRPRDPVVLPAVDSLYVVGDVHGEFDRLLRLLRSAGLVDDEERWTGGTAHLVMLGDVFDRGPDVTRALWFLYDLEAEAREAGGRVQLVLGNHEIMVLTRDLRYVSQKERSLADLRSTTYTRLFDLRRSVLGQWLASKPAVLRIGPVLLTHGGLSPRYADESVQALDDTLAAYMSGDIFRHWSDSTVEVTPVDSATLARRIDFFFGDESVFWYRGYVEGATGLSYGSPAPSADSSESKGVDTAAARARADSLSDVLIDVLRRHDSEVHVVAHTPLPRVQQGFGGRLIGVDLRRPASEALLLVRDGEAYRRYRLGEDGAVTRLEAGPPAEP